jgi:hypothetical protein
MTQVFFPAAGLLASLVLVLTSSTSSQPKLQCEPSPPFSPP